MRTYVEIYESLKESVKDEKELKKKTYTVYHKEWRNRMRAEKKCTSCGKQDYDTLHGACRCRPCADKYADKVRMWRQGKGEKKSTDYSPQWEIDVCTNCPEEDCHYCKKQLCPHLKKRAEELGEKIKGV